jgi:hypothetical protein
MELFVELMTQMSAFPGYNFTRVEIGREVHPPDYWMQADEQVIRQGLVKLFRTESHSVSLRNSVKMTAHGTGGLLVVGFILNMTEYFANLCHP